MSDYDHNVALAYQVDSNRVVAEWELRAFHGKPGVKQKYVRRLMDHRVREHLMQGVGYQRGQKGTKTRGCAVGCTLNRYAPEAYPKEIGFPLWAANYQDTIFENLDPVSANQFAVDFLTETPVGAYVNSIRWRLSRLRCERVLGILLQLDGGYQNPKILENYRRILTWSDDGDWRNLVCLSSVGSEAMELSLLEALVEPQKDPFEIERYREFLAHCAYRIAATIGRNLVYVNARSPNLQELQMEAFDLDRSFQLLVDEEQLKVMDLNDERAFIPRFMNLPALWPHSGMATWKWEAETLIRLLREAEV